jgi:alkylated DNA nucleotide flippase Atl1
MARHDPIPRIQQILWRVRAIPRGRVQTYGGIDPEAPRMVGRILHDTDEDVPWHRVVRADGSLAKGERQRKLLIAEGVPMKGDRVDLRRARDGMPAPVDRPTRTDPRDRQGTR